MNDDALRLQKLIQGALNTDSPQLVEAYVAIDRLVAMAQVSGNGSPRLWSVSQVPTRDREADRQRFPDPEFNRWLDEGISDSGHTVWDQIHDVGAAWCGWYNRPYYATQEPQAAAEPVAFVPVHPRLGPLWCETFSGAEDKTEARPKSYPLLPLYIAPQAAVEPQAAQVESGCACRWNTKLRQELALYKLTKTSEELGGYDGGREERK